MEHCRMFDTLKRHICRSSLLVVIIFLLYPSSCYGGRPGPTGASAVQESEPHVLDVNLEQFNGTISEIQTLQSAPVEFVQGKEGLESEEGQRKMLKADKASASKPQTKQAVQPANPLQGTSKFLPQIWWSRANARVLMQGVQVTVRNVGKKVVTGFVCTTNARAGIRAGDDFYFPEGGAVTYRTILLPDMAAVVTWYVQAGPRVNYGFKCSATTYY